MDTPEDRIRACVADMERQWRAGDDFPEKNRDILSGSKDALLKATDSAQDGGE